MSGTSAALLVLVVPVAILLCHRTLASLRTWLSVAGTAAVCGGYAVLLTYCVEVEFSLLAEGSTWTCAERLGLSGDVSTLRALIDVQEHFYPPSVDCLAGGEVRTLTDADVTAVWATVWQAGWVLLVCGVVLLAAGLLRSREWSRRPLDQARAPEQLSGGAGSGQRR